jgi:hypothetical protein
MADQTRRFDSMEEMARQMAPERGGAMAFPLFDDSPAEHWLSCSGETPRRMWASEWVARRAKFSQPVESRDFLAIAAYEADASKMEKSLGWSALAMWLEAAKSNPPGSALRGDKVLGLLPKLLASGASMKAFQAAHPQALALVIGLKRENDENFWEGAVALLEAGWDPNAWDPVTEPKTGSSMQAAMRCHAAIGESSSSSKNKFDSARVAARWMEVVRAAQGAGFDLDSRSMDGMTALGMCGEYKAYLTELLKNEGDPRMSALMALGADPSKASQFWLITLENDPKTQQEAAAALAHAQLRTHASEAVAPKTVPKSL